MLGNESLGCKCHSGERERKKHFAVKKYGKAVQALSPGLWSSLTYRRWRSHCRVVPQPFYAQDYVETHSHTLSVVRVTLCPHPHRLWMCWLWTGHVHLHKYFSTAPPWMTLKAMTSFSAGWRHSHRVTIGSHLKSWRAFVNVHVTKFLSFFMGYSKKQFLCAYKAVIQTLSNTT